MNKPAEAFSCWRTLSIDQTREKEETKEDEEQARKWVAGHSKSWQNRYTLPHQSHSLISIAKSRSIRSHHVSHTIRLCSKLHLHLLRPFLSCKPPFELHLLPVVQYTALYKEIAKEMESYIQKLSFRPHKSFNSQSLRFFVPDVYRVPKRPFHDVDTRIASVHVPW